MNRMCMIPAAKVFIFIVVEMWPSTAQVSGSVECQQPYDPIGLAYVGTKSTTNTGKSCQRWDSQTPHSHDLTDPVDFSGGISALSEAEDYCRNPDDDESGLWCHTTDPNEEYEYCTVATCADTTTQETTAEYMGASTAADSTTRDTNIQQTQSGPATTEPSHQGPAECLMSGDPFGLLYVGTKSTTAGGTPCQRWDAQTPNSHSNTDPADFSGGINALSEAEAYCRNPDHDASGVWCYTVDPALNYDYCAVDSCDGTTAQATTVSIDSGTVIPGMSVTEDATTLQVEVEPRTTEAGTGSTGMPAEGDSGTTEAVQSGPVECLYRDDPQGMTYAGTRSTTDSGKQCQRWDHQAPHAHSFTDPSVFAGGIYDLSEAENYCRNPDWDIAGPWCMTVDPEEWYDYCTLATCEVSPTQVAAVTADSGDGSAGVPTITDTIIQHTSDYGDVARGSESPPSLECLMPGDPLGQAYVGTKSSTTSGIPCQRWDSQTPHTHDNTDPTDFAGGIGSLSDAENYCRNPDIDSDGVWCYTIHPEEEYDYCTVPSCDSPAQAATVTADSGDGSARVPTVTDTIMHQTSDYEHVAIGSERPPSLECRMPGDPLGRAYVGTKSTTTSGIPCQRWDSQTPHTHDDTDPTDFAGGIGSLSDAENYCRNPDIDMDGLWCYTIHPEEQYDACTVPICGSEAIAASNITLPQTITETVEGNPESKNKTSNKNTNTARPMENGPTTEGAVNPPRDDHVLAIALGCGLGIVGVAGLSAAAFGIIKLWKIKHPVPLSSLTRIHPDS